MVQLIVVTLVGLVASALTHAQEVRVWNPYFQEPATVRAAAASAEHESAALRQVNLRRTQIGLTTLSSNPQLAQAAAGHSAYLAANNLVGHFQSLSDFPTGFTGTNVGDRLTAARYPWRSYGEVISFGPATGALGVEKLIEAIYHRFGLFDPGVDEAGAGHVATHPSYRSVLTINLGNQRTPSLGTLRNWVGMYPSDGQRGVPIDFYSDEESPDPVPNANRVGYPISLHIGFGRTLAVDSFTLSDARGTTLQTTLLAPAQDGYTPVWAAAIIPTQPLTPGETYIASFLGKADGTGFERVWRFTAAPASKASLVPSSVCVPAQAVRKLKIIYGSGNGNVNIGGINSSLIKLAFLNADEIEIIGLSPGALTLTATFSDATTALADVVVAADCPASADALSDRLFNWAEDRYRHLFEPPGAKSISADGYYYRYYPVTNTYLGTKTDGSIWFLDSFSGALLPVGDIGNYVNQFANDGY